MNGPEDENAPAMVVAPGFNVGIREKEDGKNDNDNIPSREYQAVHKQANKKERQKVHRDRTIQVAYVKVSATEPILSGAYQAENATMAGICSRQT